MNGTTRVAVQPISPQVGDPNWRATAVADINGDGHPDLVWRHVDGWIAVMPMVGHSGPSVQMLSTDNVASPSWRITATGDLDQDGHVDLVWHNDANGDLVWWRLNGTSHVSSGPLSPASVSNLQWKVRGGADINADGMTDLLWQNTVTGEVTVWFMNGTALQMSTLTTPGILTDLSWRLVAPK
jgi:hypothetical protein